MKHGLRLLVIVILSIGLLSGCSDYRAMKDTNIITGFAVDKNEEGEYEITFEIIDLSGASEESGAKSTMVSATGSTITEATSNCKRKVSNWIYYGSMRTVIISQDLAREDGISYIIDVLLREVQYREDIDVVISQEDSAKSLLMATGMESNNTSYEIAYIIEENYEFDSTSAYLQLYEVYDNIHAKGQEMVLPAFRIVENGDVELTEINGMAIFQDDKLVGYMSPEDTHYYSMITKSDTGGIISFIDPETEDSVAFDIKKCTNQSKVQYADGKVSIDVTVTVQCANDEYPDGDFTLDHVITRLEKEIESLLTSRINEVFKESQKEPGVDIYGFGNKIYRDQYGVWLDISDRWTELFQNAEINVQVKADILNNSIIS